MIIGAASSRGAGSGLQVRLTRPLSFWGGTDDRGRIIDVHHPQCGAELAGRVLIMQSGRGSSSSSSVLAEQIRSGSAPAAIILFQPDPIITLGAIVADELYDLAMPIIVVEAAELTAVPADVELAVSAPTESSLGTISWLEPGEWHLPTP